MENEKASAWEDITQRKYCLLRSELLELGAERRAIVKAIREKKAEQQRLKEKEEKRIAKEAQEKKAKQVADDEEFEQMREKVRFDYVESVYLTSSVSRASITTLTEALYCTLFQLSAQLV